MSEKLIQEKKKKQKQIKKTEELPATKKVSRKTQSIVDETNALKNVQKAKKRRKRAVSTYESVSKKKQETKNKGAIHQRKVSEKYLFFMGNESPKKSKQVISTQKIRNQKELEKQKLAPERSKKLNSSSKAASKTFEKQKTRSKNSPIHAAEQAKRSTKAQRQRKKQWQLAQRKKQQRRQRIRTLGISIGGGVLFVMLVLMYFFSVTKVYGYSMLPTLADGDLVIINKQTNVTRYQLIAFRTDKKDVIVRRVVGFPGEKIELRQGKLYVNDEERVEFYLAEEETSAEKVKPSLADTGQEISGLQSVPEHTYYVLGDNRSYATDSRYFGPVSEDQVIGVVTMRQPEESR